MSIARQSSYTAAGLSNITKSRKEHTTIVVQAGVEVLSCLVRFFEGLQKTLVIRFGANQCFWHTL